MSSFEIEKNNNYAIIKFQAKTLVDNKNRVSLKTSLETLNSEGVKNIIFDLTDIRFCDSLGLTFILITYRMCKTNKGKFVLTGLQQHVKKVIAISRLDTILTITNYLPDALMEIINTSAQTNFN